MSLFRICPEDDVLRSVRSHFNAIPLKVPSNYYQPMFVFASKGSKAIERGPLKFLLSDLDFNLEPTVSELPNIAGKKTTSMDLSFGFQLLAGMLKGLIGMPAPIEGAFKNARNISISFNNVKQKSISPAELGRALKSIKLDVENPALNFFISRPEYKMLFIDNIITSNSFTIHATGSSETSAKINVPLVTKICAELNSKLKVTSASEDQVTFEGEDHLTFAFTCMELKYSVVTGKVREIGESIDIVSPKNMGGEIHVTEKHTDMLADEMGLLSWD